jgi:hypothetical protein
MDTDFSDEHAASVFRFRILCPNLTLKSLRLGWDSVQDIVFLRHIAVRL